jgi:hypothetical protein
VHHADAGSEVREAASPQAAEAPDDGSVWDHLLPAGDPVLRPVHVDVRGESSARVSGELPRRLPEWPLLPLGRDLQHLGLLRQ